MMRKKAPGNEIRQPQKNSYWLERIGFLLGWGACEVGSKRAERQHASLPTARGGFFFGHRWLPNKLSAR